MLRLLPHLLLALTVGCGQARLPTRGPGPGPTIAGVPARYEPQLSALASFVRDGDSDGARRIADRLRTRLVSDASGGKKDTEAALDLLVGFEQILEGRRLTSRLDLGLVQRLAPGGDSVGVFLRGRLVEGAGEQELVGLRTGGVILRVSQTTLSPEGQEAKAVRTQAVSDLGELELSLEWMEVPLGAFSTNIPSNCLAARRRWSLEFLAGDITQGGAYFPAQNVLVDSVERVDLAPFLPNGAVSEEALLECAQRQGGALAPLLERTVRLDPGRREEALDLLTPLVEGLVAEQITRLVPTLRWLSGTGVPGRDPMAWRAWLRRRASVRAETRWP